MRHDANRRDIWNLVDVGLNKGVAWALPRPPRKSAFCLRVAGSQSTVAVQGCCDLLSLKHAELGSPFVLERAVVKSPALPKEFSAASAASQPVHAVDVAHARHPADGRQSRRCSSPHRQAYVYVSSHKSCPAGLPQRPVLCTSSCHGRQATHVFAKEHLLHLKWRFSQCNQEPSTDLLLLRRQRTRSSTQLVLRTARKSEGTHRFSGAEV